LGDHALLLHRRRQRGQRDRDPVLDQHLREIGIGADVERDDQRVGAVARAGRLHVEHALDAVDLLLDRQGHGVDQHLGAGARIAGGDLDGRRRDRRILRDRQLQQRHRADHDRQQSDDIGEYRSLDEELRDHADAPRLSRTTNL
jgi:hypothetical protein